MPLFWPFVFSIAVLLLMVVQERWLWVLVLYLVAGALWMATDLFRSDLDRPMILWSKRGQVAVFLLWPLRVIHAAVRKVQKLRSPTRFHVSAGSWSAGSYVSANASFGKLSDAIVYAREQAVKLNSRVTVLDTANEFWLIGARQTLHVMYNVAPSGEVEKIGLRSQRG